jgi:hypothetical protein
MPIPQMDLNIQINTGEKIVKQVWFTSPDHESFALQPMAFTQEKGVLTITVPSLIVWNLLLVDWSE